MSLFKRLKRISPPRPPLQTAPLVRKGDLARDRRDWPMAARHYADALDLDPSMSGIWVQMGHALKESGSLRRAEDAYRRAIALDPGNADHFLQLGHALKLRGDAGGALLAYQKAETLDPDDQDARREAHHMRPLVAKTTTSALDWRPGLNPQNRDRIATPKVFFFPDYTPTNHYQTGLYSAFAPKIEVAFGRLEDAVAASETRSVVFHLHWPEPLFGGCETAEDVSRTAAMFWRMAGVLKANGGQLFWTAHNALPHDRRFADQMLAFHKRLVAEADLVHVHSQAAIEVLEAAYDAQIANPVVLPHGNYLDVYPDRISEADAKARLGLPEDAFVFGFVGQIRPYKGIEALVEAFQTLRHETSRPLHLLIAGKPVWPTPPGEWAARGEALDDVTVIEGFIDDDDLQVFLKASDAVVLPYRDILTSGSAVMAAGFGRPVLLPELPTMAEIIAQDLGPSFDPSAQDGLVAAMRRMGEASPEAVAAWRANAAAFAEAADWRVISEQLKRHAPRPENWDDLTVRGRHLRMAAGAPVAPGAIGVALVTHRSAEDAGEAAAAWPKMIGGRPLSVFALDNSEDPRELAKLRRLLPEAELLTADDNLGYAAGNNILLQRMRDVGCEFGLIVNPDIRIEADAIEVLLAEAEKGRIVSPLILNEAGAPSFTGGAATIGDRVSIDQVAPKGDAPYQVDLLQGSAVMAPLALLNTVGFMDESYFLYFEETDWFLSMKDKAALYVAPAAVAHHHKTSHGRAVPTLYYVYYFLRNTLIFNKKYTGSDKAAQAHYTAEFVTGWRSKIERDAPGFTAIFDALTRAAFEDGVRGVTGRIDIQARLNEIIASSDTPGGVSYIEPDAIGGATYPSFGENRRDVWLFSGDYPVLSAPANRPDPQATIADERPNCAFRIDLPHEVILGAQAPVTVRESETGAELALSPRLRTEILCDDQLHMRHFSVIEAMRHRASSFDAGLDACVNGVLRGWIYDRTLPERIVHIDLVVDGVTVAGQAANTLRHAPGRAAGPLRAIGFEARLPSRLVRGKTEISVRIRPMGLDRDVLDGKIASTWNWGNYSPDFSGEEFFRWAVLNRMTPEGAYGESPKLQRHFAAALTCERQLAADVDHGLTASIVMPVYNRERSIEAAIRSVLAQTDPNWRLIIVDDGSSDRSVEIVQRMIAEAPDHDITLIEMAQNAGVSAARNRALEHATGDVIAYLDSDNIWKPDYLSIMLAALAREPERRSAYAGSEIWVRDPETGEAELTNIFANPYSRSALETRNFIDLNVFAHRRDLYEERGGFREDMRRLVDWHLILRYTKGAPPLFLPLLLSEYFIDASAGQITATVGFEDNHEKILAETDLSDEFAS